MSQYPNTGNNQWGNVNFNNNNPNNNSSYGYGYDNNNQNVNVNVKQQQYTNNNTNSYTYGYSENIKNNNSDWRKPQVQSQQISSNGWPTNTNVNNANNSNNGWGNTFEKTQNYGYGYSDINIKSNPTLQQSGNKNIGMNFLSSPSLSLQKNLGMDSIVKLVDWDVALRQKNFSKQRSDTSWVTYQEQSWKKDQPSDTIEKQVEKKFAFPNPYIKYKIIPGVDEKKTLDVTSKDQLDKGLVKGNLIIWDYHGGPNQQFYIQRVVNQNNFVNKTADTLDQDQFLLINASTGFCVSTISQTNKNSKENGQNRLCVYPKLSNNEISQRWKLKRFQNSQNIFMIGWAGNNGQTVLDCENQSSSNGTNVLQWKANGGKNQLWKIIPA